MKYGTGGAPVDFIIIIGQKIRKMEFEHIHYFFIKIFEV